MTIERKDEQELTDKQRLAIERLRQKHGTAQVAEVYPDGAAHVVVNFGENDERDLDVESDGRYAKTKT